MPSVPAAILHPRSDRTAEMGWQVRAEAVADVLSKRVGFSAAGRAHHVCYNARVVTA